MDAVGFTWHSLYQITNPRLCKRRDSISSGRGVRSVRLAGAAVSFSLARLCATHMVLCPASPPIADIGSWLWLRSS